MDKIISSRLDEAIITQITLLARELGTSKKSVIEAAIRLYAQTIKQKTDAFDASFSAWQRDETPEETLQHSRETFRRSMMRRQTGVDDAGLH